MTQAYVRPVRKRTKMEIVSQVGVLAGSLAVFTLGSGSPWGFVIGMAVQPCWYYTAWFNRQWGLLGASMIYTIGWILGIYNNFIAPLN
jgi:hypothetical protein